MAESMERPSCPQCGAPLEVNCGCKDGVEQEVRFDDQYRQASFELLSDRLKWEELVSSLDVGTPSKEVERQLSDALAFQIHYTGEGSVTPKEQRSESAFTKAVKEKIVVSQDEINEAWIKAKEALRASA